MLRIFIVILIIYVLNIPRVSGCKKVIKAGKDPSKSRYTTLGLLVLNGYDEVLISDTWLGVNTSFSLIIYTDIERTFKEMQCRSYDKFKFLFEVDLIKIETNLYTFVNAIDIKPEMKNSMLCKICYSKLTYDCYNYIERLPVEDENLDLVDNFCALKDEMLELGLKQMKYNAQVNDHKNNITERSRKITVDTTTSIQTTTHNNTLKIVQNSDTTNDITQIFTQQNKNQNNNVLVEKTRKIMPNVTDIPRAKGNTTPNIVQNLHTEYQIAQESKRNMISVTIGVVITIILLSLIVILSSIMVYMRKKCKPVGTISNIAVYNLNSETESINIVSVSPNNDNIYEEVVYEEIVSRNDIGNRPFQPLPSEDEENKKYIHYDTPYDHRFDRRFWPTRR